jgi:dTDP-glucose 4,6-dehydratase
MKILVTGGAGFIGSNFIRHVLGLGRGYSILNLDKLTYAGNLANLEAVAKHPHYTFVKGDICDTTVVEAAMSGCDAVVHFAAESHVDRSIYEPAACIETNVRHICASAGRAQAWSAAVHPYIYGRSVRRHAPRRLRG